MMADLQASVDQLEKNSSSAYFKLPVIAKGTVASRVSTIQRVQEPIRSITSLSRAPPITTREKEGAFSVIDRRRAVSAILPHRNNSLKTDGVLLSIENVVSSHASENVLCCSEDEMTYIKPHDVKTHKTSESVSDRKFNSHQIKDDYQNLPSGAQSFEGNFDGPSELARVRARLRSITQKRKSKSGKEEQGEDMLDELDTLLQNAIQEHTENESNIRVQGQELKAAGPTAIVDSRHDAVFEDAPTGSIDHFTDLPNPRLEGLTRHFVISNTTSQTNGSVETEVTEHEYDNKQSIFPTVSTAITALQDDMSRARSSPAKQAVPVSYTESTEPDVLDRQYSPGADITDSIPTRDRDRRSIFSRYRSRPVKQRAALFETFTPKPSGSDAACMAPHAGEVHQNRFRPQPLAASQHISRPAPRSPNPDSMQQHDSFLIPLKLPQLVNSHKIVRSVAESDGGGVSIDVDSASQATSISSAKSQINVIGDEESEHTLRQSHRPQQSFLSQHSNTGLVEHDPYRKTPDRTIRVPKHQAPSVSHTTILHSPTPSRTATTYTSVDAAEGKMGQKSHEKRPSIVKSTIQQLMASSRTADKQQRNPATKNNDTGKVETSQIQRGLQETDDVAPKKLPALQMPLAEQAKMYRDDAMHIPENFEDNRQVNSSPVRTPVSQIRSASPSKTLPETPLRGRSKKITHSPSTADSPYSIEQRLSLSSGPKSPRITRSRVRVSIEVRDSPERIGNDDQMLVVRASIEPEDYDRDSS